MIRRELSIELVRVHGISQADVARRMDLTDAAISQYLRMKRGGADEYRSFESYKVFREELRKSAEMVVDGAETVLELCRLCGVCKSCGLLADIYHLQTGEYPPKCID